MSNEIFDWEEEDSKLVQEESERLLEEQQAWIRHDDYLTALDEARHDFRHHLANMTLEEEETALEGLMWYEKHFIDDIDIEDRSWVYGLDSNSSPDVD